MEILKNLDSKFFDELTKMYPEEVECFYFWLKRYQKDCGWVEEYSGGESFDKDFFDLNYEFQIGLILRFEKEFFYERITHHQLLEPNKFRSFVRELFDRLQKKIPIKSGHKVRLKAKIGYSVPQRLIVYEVLEVSELFLKVQSVIEHDRDNVKSINSGQIEQIDKEHFERIIKHQRVVK